MKDFGNLDYSNLIDDIAPKREVKQATTLEADQTGLYLIVSDDETSLVVRLHEVFRCLYAANKLWYENNGGQIQQTETEET